MRNKLIDSQQRFEQLVITNNNNKDELKLISVEKSDLISEIDKIKINYNELVEEYNKLKNKYNTKLENSLKTSKETEKTILVEKEKLKKEFKK